MVTATLLVAADSEWSMCYHHVVLVQHAAGSAAQPAPTESQFLRKHAPVAWIRGGIMHSAPWTLLKVWGSVPRTYFRRDMLARQAAGSAVCAQLNWFAECVGSCGKTPEVMRNRIHNTIDAFERVEWLGKRFCVL